MLDKKVFTVSEINLYIKGLMQNDPLLSGLLVKGEISNFKLHTSGHLYFTLKDNDSRIKCVMFRGNSSKIKFRPEDGMSVILMGYFSVYERDGAYQMYVEDMTPDGYGALYMAYEQLKNRLSQEGLFDTSRKKTIPFLPGKVGIVTSPTGAAVRDVISIIRRRCPMVDIILYPALVQGVGAAEDIAKGIEFFNRQMSVDVIIAGRGGGSIEELWAFNEEVVARAIYASTIPVISAVGHETDYTIADFVADLRAATPSAAAELAVPDMKNLIARCSQARYNLDNAIVDYVNRHKQKLERLSTDNSFRRLETKIISMNQTLDTLDKYLHIYMQNIVRQNQHRFVNALEKLNLLNPAASLLRGYAYVKDDEDKILISSVDQVKTGDKLGIFLKDGKLNAEVLEIIKENN